MLIDCHENGAIATIRERRNYHPRLIANVFNAVE